MRIRAESRDGYIWLRYFDGYKLEFRIFYRDSREEVPLYPRLDTTLTGVPVDVSADDKGRLLLISEREELWRETEMGKWVRVASGLNDLTTFCTSRQTGDGVWVSSESTNMMPQKIRVAHIDIYGQIGNQAEIDDYVSLSVLSDTELWVQSRERVGILASTGIVQSFR